MSAPGTQSAPRRQLYRFSGVYNYAPDRGSPDGHTSPFVKRFRVLTDDEARAWVHRFRHNRAPIENEKLVRVASQEETVVVPLA